MGRRKKVLLNFAERRTRQCVHLRKGPRHLERRERLPAGALERGRIDRSVGDHVRHGHFAAHGINLHMFEALLSLYEATKSEEVWYEINSELTAIERLYEAKYVLIRPDQHVAWRGDDAAEAGAMLSRAAGRHPGFTNTKAMT